ncbi:MAG TPA: hypothetical protein VMZ53_19555 [Kofleriaceae bacterium]|nr:hypothetical protein [Kofleriaceae bacterium]
MRGVIVEVSSRKYGVPYECPCCGAAPDAEMRVTSETGHALDTPYCKRCVGHVDKWEWAGIRAMGMAVGGLVLAIVLALVVSFLVAAIVLVIAIAAAAYLRSSGKASAKHACGASCASPQVALAYGGWNGTTHSFTFESPTFAARFAEQNAAILANETPQLRKLLDGYKKARLAVPTPAVAAGVAPPPLTARDWIARIESTDGKVARRVALGRALEMIDQPQPRRELVQTVARLELAPMLDKLQRTSSPAAKKALLQTSIQQLRNENVSDELEAALTTALEARVKELG